MHVLRWALALLGLVAAAPHSAVAQPAKPEKADVSLVIGGASAQLYYLPLVLTSRLGFFEKEGLNVTVIDAGSGAKGLQALIGGSADVTAGSYEHPIRMQARGQDVVAIVKFGRFHGNVLGVTRRRAAQYKSPADLKGWKIGVSAPGSSTHIFVQTLMAKHGLKNQDVAIIGVGQTAGGIAAVRTGGELDAVSLTDPVMSELENSGDVVVVADSRNLDGTIAAYGGETVSGVLYTTGAFAAKNPGTVQALAAAVLRTVDWIKAASIDDIVAKMPPQYVGERPDFYRQVLARNIESYRGDGTISPEAAALTLGFLRATDAELQKASVDLTKTYDNRFVERARKAAR